MGLDEASFSELFFNSEFIVGMVASLIGGFIGFGLLTWYLHEYWYRKALAHIENHNKALDEQEEAGGASANKMSLDKLDVNPKEEIISLKPKKELNPNNKFFE